MAEVKDKSATHVRVMKNGHPAWISKEVWKNEKDRNGFMEIAEAPPEAVELRAKIKVKEAAVVTDPIPDELTGELEVKSLKKKKAKDETQE